MRCSTVRAAIQLLLQAGAEIGRFNAVNRGWHGFPRGDISEQDTTMRRHGGENQTRFEARLQPLAIQDNTAVQRALPAVSYRLLGSRVPPRCE